MCQKILSRYYLLSLFDSEGVGGVAKSFINFFVQGYSVILDICDSVLSNSWRILDIS
jgi:hypothetical protein